MVALADENGRGSTSHMAVTEDDETPGSARIGIGLTGRLGAALATPEEVPGCEDESGIPDEPRRNSRQLGQGHPPQNRLVRMGLAGRGDGSAEGRLARNGGWVGSGRGSGRSAVRRRSAANRRISSSRARNEGGSGRSGEAVRRRGAGRQPGKPAREDGRNGGGGRCRGPMGERVGDIGKSRKTTRPETSRGTPDGKYEILYKQDIAKKKKK